MDHEADGRRGHQARCGNVQEVFVERAGDGVAGVLDLVCGHLLGLAPAQGGGSGGGGGLSGTCMLACHGPN